MQANIRIIYNKPLKKTLFRCETAFLYHFYTLLCHYGCQGSV